MINTKSAKWQRRRSEFNHDWLKNRFIPALSRLLNLLDRRIDDPALEVSFATNVLLEWDAHRNEAFTLPNDFEVEMTPRILFEQPPLSYCDEEKKQWLGDLADLLWKSRYPVSDWVQNALQAAISTDDACNRLRAALERNHEIRSVESLQPLRPLFAEFEKACRNLAKAIEPFLREVRIV
jgi:hypothetical protein